MALLSVAGKSYFNIYKYMCGYTDSTSKQKFFQMQNSFECKNYQDNGFIYFNLKPLFVQHMMLWIILLGAEDNVLILTVILF